MMKSRPRRAADASSGRPVGISAADWAELIDEGPPIERPGGLWGIWTDYGHAATEHYAKKHPGYRPSAWWRREGFTGCAGRPNFTPSLKEGESELAWLEKFGCLFEGENEAALKSKAKRPAHAQAFHEAHWRYVREAHARGHTAVV